MVRVCVFILPNRERKVKVGNAHLQDARVRRRVDSNLDKST